MRITVVVPFSRPENWPLVLANFERQTHDDRRLLIVANGAGLNHVPLLHGVSIIASGESPAQARNTGLDWARRHGGGAVSFWDDDDHYGPGYLGEVAEHLAGHPQRVTAKAIRYVRWPDGLYYCLAEQPAPTFGCALSGFTERLPDFRLVHLEDAVYGQELAFAGITIHALGPQHFVHNRTSTGRRECSATQAQFLRSFGPALNLGDAPDSVADLPGIPHGEPVPVPTWDALLDELAERSRKESKELRA